MHRTNGDLKILDVIAAAGVALKQQGSDRFAGLCPFHDDHNPSLMVTPSKGLWHCFGCGVGGNAAEFMRRYALLKGVVAGTDSTQRPAAREEVTLV